MGSFASHACCDPGGVRSMVLDRLCVELRLVVLVKENFGDDDLLRDVLAVLVRRIRRAIRCIALGKPCRIAESGRIEEWVVVVNAGVDVSDLDPSSSVSSASRGRPRTRGIDDLVALAQVG